MTTGAALPALQTERRIIEEHLPTTGPRHRFGALEGDRFYRSGTAAHFQNAQGVGEIIGNVGAAAGKNDCAWTAVSFGKLNALTCSDEKGEVIRNCVALLIGLNGGQFLD